MKKKKLILQSNFELLADSLHLIQITSNAIDKERKIKDALRLASRIRKNIKDLPDETNMLMENEDFALTNNEDFDRF